MWEPIYVNSPCDRKVELVVPNCSAIYLPLSLNTTAFARPSVYKVFEIRCALYFIYLYEEFVKQKAI